MLPSALPAACLLLFVTAAAAADCPAGAWQPFEDTCYLLLPHLFSTRTEAAAACQDVQEDATLPSVHSIEQNWHLQNVDSGHQYTDIWLGLSRVNGTTLQWQDGSPLDFTNWLGDEPNNTGDCVYMDFFTAKWRDINCATAHFFVVCQYTP